MPRVEFPELSSNNREMRAPKPVLALLLLLSGCASSPLFTASASRPPDEVRCEQRTEAVFAILGEIDDATTECVRSKFRHTTQTLFLDTPGGSVGAALDIAEVFEGRRLEMRVEGECNSSCANYFLPLAGRIVLGPDAMVLLHGSVDPWTIERWRARRADFMAQQAREGHDEAEAAEMFEELIATARGLLDRQDAFARRNNVPPGWLLYREADSGRVSGLANQPPPSRAVLVEEAMIRSCLLNAEVAPFQQTLERAWIRSPRRLGLLWARIVPSGKARCRVRDRSEHPRALGQ